jgi:predicted nuclease of predicted toxin-antitoxin system
VIRILIDENLPATLSAKLDCVCMHATALGQQPTDKELWDYARRENWTLLTKDADFFEQLVINGTPPKVIWLRTGNLRRTDLETLLVKRWPQITSILSTADLVEVHADHIEGLSLGPA